MRNHYNELRVQLVEKTALARAARRRVPRASTTASASATSFRISRSCTRSSIGEELTEFAVAEPATAWWIPAGEWNRYEYLYNRTPLTEVGQAHTPITIRTGERPAHRASTRRRSSTIRRCGCDGSRAAPEGRAVAVRRRAAKVRRTRAVHDAVAHDADRDRRRRRSYMSDLILNLNEPNKLGDVSWFKPGKYVGIWWAMHLGT